VDLKEPLVLVFGDFHLLSTVSRIRLPSDIQGQVHGRSSIGRKGTIVHFTAGFIDPGFNGQITLEVMNLNRDNPTWTLLPGDRIAQITFCQMNRPAARPYHGRYQNQVGATPSKFEHGDL